MTKKRYLLLLLTLPLWLGGCANRNTISGQTSDGEHCEKREDCKEGSTCVDRVCRKVCINSDQCTSTQECKNGVCIFKEKDLECSDDSQCVNPPVCFTTNEAKCVAGKCQYNSKADTSVDCDDGNVCTVNDKCDGNGQCVGGSPLVCDNPPASICVNDNTQWRVFTTDGATCVSEDNQGCVYQYVDEPCPDCEVNSVQGTCHECLTAADCPNTHTWYECFVKDCVDNKCQYTPSTDKPCGNRCVDGVFYAFGACADDGESCTGTQTSCNGFACANEKDCKTICTNNDDCIASNYCLDGTCAPKFVDGTSCDLTAAGNECLGGHCSVTVEAGHGICCEGSKCCHHDNDCDDGMACNKVTNTCLPEAEVMKMDLGASCQLGEECRSGNCVDNTCCSMAKCQDDYCVNGKATAFSCANEAGECASVTTDCGNFGCKADGVVCNTACTNNSDCADGFFCNSSAQCEEKHAQGKTCGTVKAASDGAGSTCATGNCVDGVCCGSASCGTCQTCESGSCANVAKNQKDNDSCNDSSHVCDGKGNCDLINGQSCSQKEVCVDEFCVDAHCCPEACNIADKCEGTGSSAKTTSYSCATGKCEKSVTTCTAGCNTAKTACNGKCSKNSDCDAGNYCATDGTCKAKLANGKTCVTTNNDGTNGSCTSGFCADGFCCDGACNTACKSCKLTDHVGKCTTVTNAEDDKCSGTKTCDASGNCDFKNGQSCTSSTAAQCLSGYCVDGHCCSSSSCTNSCSKDIRTVYTCGTSGSCVAGTPAACDGHHSCKDGTSCYTGTCTADGQCADGYYCSGGECKSQKAPGNTCTKGNECASGNCVDGHCCSSASCGTCQNCNTGSCVTVSGMEDPDTCSGTKTCTANGSCKLKQGQSCTGGADCSSGVCSGDKHCCDNSCTDTCNGNTLSKANCSSGTCSRTTSTCANNLKCNSTNTDCLKSCSKNEDCAGNTYCNSSGQCVAKLASKSSKTCNANMLKEPSQGADTVCADGHCVDGYCCDTACSTANSCSNNTFTTYACNVSGYLGTCKTTPQSCGTTSCSGNTKTTRSCSTTSGCSSSTSTCAGNFKCNSSGTDCLTSCSKNEDCVGNTYCNSSGQCVAKLASSSSKACTANMLKDSADGVNSICTDGHCVDGYCCNTACNGSCQSCGLSGNLGTCSTVKNATDNTCTGDNICDSNGTCKRLNGKSCGSGSDCNSGHCFYGYCCATSCSNQCNNGIVDNYSCLTGTCTKVSTSSCDGLQCANSTSCKSSCSTDSDCLSGGTCIDGKCYDLRKVGYTCSSNSDCIGSNFTYPGISCYVDKTCRIGVGTEFNDNVWGCRYDSHCIPSSSQARCEKKSGATYGYCHY